MELNLNMNRLDTFNIDLNNWDYLYSAILVFVSYARLNYGYFNIFDDDVYDLALLIFLCSFIPGVLIGLRKYWKMRQFIPTQATVINNIPMKDKENAYFLYQIEFFDANGVMIRSDVGRYKEKKEIGSPIDILVNSKNSQEFISSNIFEIHFKSIMYFIFALTSIFMAFITYLFSC